MKAVRGNVNRHHFSHKISCDCSAKGKTDFHLKWQNMCNEKSLERRFEKNGKLVHIADIVNKDGLVIEVQHSQISENDIFAREGFYEKMIWILDCTESKYRRHGNYIVFDRPKAYVKDCGSFKGIDVFCDIGDCIGIRVFDRPICKLMSYEQFIQTYFKNIVSEIPVSLTQTFEPIRSAWDFIEKYHIDCGGFDVMKCGKFNGYCFYEILKSGDNYLDWILSGEWTGELNKFQCFLKLIRSREYRFVKKPSTITASFD